MKQQEDFSEKLKKRQIKLIVCTKAILNAGRDLAEVLTCYYNTLTIMGTKHKQEQSATTNDFSTQGQAVTEEVVSDTSIKIISQEQLVEFQKEWEQHIANERLLSELEEALEKENYNAMTKQQLRYTQVSSDKVGEGKDSEHIDGEPSVEYLIQEVESAYSEISFPDDAAKEDIESMIESVVKFAVALNSFHEAISSTHDEGFDLTNMILISLKHPAILTATDLFAKACAESIADSLGEAFGEAIVAGAKAL